MRQLYHVILNRFDEVNQAFLDRTRSHRNKNTVAPEEKTPDALKNHRARDVFALGVLIEELFEGVTNEGANNV